MDWFMLIEIREDRILKGHVHSLYENLLEQNLFRIVEPYSQVQIAHIAKLVGLSEQEIQNKWVCWIRVLFKRE